VKLIPWKHVAASVEEHFPEKVDAFKRLQVSPEKPKRGTDD